MDAVDVLLGTHRPNGKTLVQVLWQGELDQDTVELGIVVKALN